MLLGAAAVARADPAAVPTFKDVDSMEARVQGCVICHGQNGQGTGNGYYPRIAGKPAGYLYNQLAAFSRRDSTLADELPGGLPATIPFSRDGGYLR
jgi:cytochrome c553